MLVTEIIPGPEDSYHSFYGYLDERGESLIHVTKQKFRQYPPLFGLATYHVMSREPEVMELGLRSARASVCGASASWSSSATRVTGASS